MPPAVDVAVDRRAAHLNVGFADIGACTRHGETAAEDVAALGIIFLADNGRAAENDRGLVHDGAGRNLQVTIGPHAAGHAARKDRNLLSLDAVESVLQVLNHARLCRIRTRLVLNVLEGVDGRRPMLPLCALIVTVLT